MSYKEVYKSTEHSSIGTFEYVKNNLKYMGNIIEFKVFSDEEHEYYETINDTKYYYNLILSDDNDNEFWLSSNCGYSGTGPVTTCEILELVGLRENYDIFNKKRVHEYDLEPNYDLNILVVEIGSGDEYKVDFLSEITFDNSYSRYVLVEALKVLGSIHNLDREDYRFNKYFINPNIEQGYGEYGVNQILFLDRPLHNMNSKAIKDIIENIVSKYCDDINTLNINCILKDK